MPNFQVSFGYECNLLDLVMSESINRINWLKHLPPLGGIEHGHHVLNFNYYYQHEQGLRETMQKCKLLFKRGKYAELSNYFTSFNWEKDLMDLDAKQASF